MRLEIIIWDNVSVDGSKKIIDALIELGIEEDKSNQFGIWGKIYEKEGRAYMKQEWIINGCGWPYLCD